MSLDSFEVPCTVKIRLNLEGRDPTSTEPTQIQKEKERFDQLGAVWFSIPRHTIASGRAGWHMGVIYPIVRIEATLERSAQSDR